MGTVRVAFDTAFEPPYGGPTYPWGTLVGRVTGPTRLARLFELALSRSQRRLTERRRVLEPRRRRPSYRPYVPIREVETPKGWHRRGDCPDCTEG